MEETKTYELAGFGQRFVALVIDGIILGIIGSIFGVSTSLWGGGVVGVAVGALYQWYFLTRQNGQTPGKMALGIRVIKVDGSPLNEVDAVMRYIGYVVNALPFLFGLGWLWALIDANNQGWHDKLARTYVVKADSEKVARVKNTRVSVGPDDKLKNEDLY
jgi:uncharacterized RDD family membrane protein YckC